VWLQFKLLIHINHEFRKRFSELLALFTLSIFANIRWSHYLLDWFCGILESLS